MISEIPLPFSFPGPFGPIHSISSFAFFLVLSFISGAMLASRELARRGLNPAVTEWVLILGVFGTLIGAKVGYVFEVWSRIWVVTDSVPDTMMHLWLYSEGMGVKVPGAVGLWESLFARGGLVFYGGFFFAVAFIWLYLKWRRLNVWQYGDVFFMMLALGYGVGRIGCMVSGDGCYGYAAPVHIPILTMVYGSRSAIPSDGVVVWNTPLIEAILSWSLFAWMMLYGRFRNYRPGFFVALFLIYDGLARLAVEFLRINDAAIPLLPHPRIGQTPLLHHNEWPGNPTAHYFENWYWYGLTQSQIVGIVLCMIGVTWMLVHRLYLPSLAAREQAYEPRS